MAILDSKTTKLVNVYTRSPIRSMSGLPIRSSTRSINLSISDIHACIVAKARVEEILLDGSVITLNFSNYNRDNNEELRKQMNGVKDTPAEPIVVKKVEKKTTKKVAEPVVETPVQEEVPVVEVTTDETPVEEEAPVVEEPVQEEVPVVEVTTDETPVEEAQTEEKPAKKYRRKKKTTE